jgi:hypothetical protein
MDKFQQLTFDATFSVCILANPEKGDYELADLDLSNERVHTLKERGMEFCGVLGIVKGRPRFALALPVTDAIVSALLQAFVQKFEDAINGLGGSMGDSAEFLQRLYELPDYRELN